MSMALALFILAGLLAVAALHLAWALGSAFPAADEKALARMVVGFRGIEKMPPRAASAAVALIALLCAFWPFVMSGRIATGLPDWVVIWGGIKLALIFGLRGALGYTPWWRRLTPEQPFARLDRKYYSPFCLAVSLAFVILTLDRTA